MSNTDFMVDFIQSSKKQFVDATVTDAKIKKGLHEFVDKQTELCKIISRNMQDFTKILLDNATSKNSRK